MVKIDTSTSLENFRRFIMTSTCKSFAPESYVDDNEIFPEREDKLGAIYVEAADKVTIKKIRDITFVNARDILGIIYNSRSGNTKLNWRQIQKFSGKVIGEASENTVKNLAACGILTLEWIEDYAQQIRKN
ncbi:MAG: hypothetical protein R1F52_03890 [Candidatus Nitrosoabyssus spongiisocia]|nr:MAG: hypothetical protein R1F52_03890 [Nitrosopumilaceae archaeon AB1(1)]